MLMWVFNPTPLSSRNPTASPSYLHTRARARVHAASAAQVSASAANVADELLVMSGDGGAFSRNKPLPTALFVPTVIRTGPRGARLAR